MYPVNWVPALAFSGKSPLKVTILWIDIDPRELKDPSMCCTLIIQFIRSALLHINSAILVRFYMVEFTLFIANKASMLSVLDVSKTMTIFFGVVLVSGSDSWCMST